MKGNILTRWNMPGRHTIIRDKACRPYLQERREKMNKLYAELIESYVSLLERSLYSRIEKKLPIEKEDIRTEIEGIKRIIQHMKEEEGN